MPTSRMTMRITTTKSALQDFLVATYRMKNPGHGGERSSMTILDE